MELMSKLTLTVRSVMKNRPCWAVLRVCKSSTSRAYSVYCRINWSISNTLWPWSDSLCFLHLAAKAYNNTSIVVFQGQKSCSNPGAVVCGPSSCCIVSNRTYHLHHFTAPTSKEIPSPNKNNRSVGITWIMFIDKVWRRRTGARVSLTAPEATAKFYAQRRTLYNSTNAWQHGLGRSASLVKGQEVMESPCKTAFQLECPSRRPETATADWYCKGQRA